MWGRKAFVSTYLIIIIVLSFTISVQAYERTLYQEMQGSDVVNLQDSLKQLGFFPEGVSSTGYYGSITTRSVREFQKHYGLEVDGIAGVNTFGMLEKLTGDNGSRGVERSEDILVPWFGKAENIFKIGDIANIYDIESGLTYKLKRTFGYNHADCETLTANDTGTLLNTYGGSFSWDRRAIIVDVNGVRMAASIAAMPHAGREDLASCAYASWRSGGYGAGSNLDAVKGNNMSGVVDVHFYGSKTHGTNSVSSTHQDKVRQAAQWEKNK